MADCPKFPDLKTVILNTSLKREADQSHTQILLDAITNLMEKAEVEVTTFHLSNHIIPPGIYPDMTEHGYDKDEWPEIWKTIQASEILIIGTPLWLGEESSLCRVAIERLYAMSGELNSDGQSIFYGKTGGAVITGNEDGVKHTAMSLLFALQHLGYTIPPQADCGWIGEIGPGPSFGDKQKGGAVGFDSDFTKRNTTIMTWNLLQLANMLKSNGGFPKFGNDREAWEKGERFGFELTDRSIN